MFPDTDMYVYMYIYIYILRVHRCASDVELKKKRKASGRMCCTSSGRFAFISESGGRGGRNISICKRTATELTPCDLLQNQTLVAKPYTRRSDYRLSRILCAKNWAHPNPKNLNSRQGKRKKVGDVGST